MDLGSTVKQGRLRRGSSRPNYELRVGQAEAALVQDRVVLHASRDRLRPILMTTLALVGGMLPLALGSGPGAVERRGIAVVGIGGQSLSLFLTLIVTPSRSAWSRRHARSLGVQPPAVVATA